MIEFDADYNALSGRSHYDDGYLVSPPTPNPTHCTAVCIDGVHVDRVFKTPFAALDWAARQDGCDGKNHVFFRHEL